MFYICLRSCEVKKYVLALWEGKYSVLGISSRGIRAPYADEICENDLRFVLLDVIAV